MKLSSLQCGRFYRLYDAFLSFAVPRIDELGLEPGVDDLSNELAMVDITRRLWGSSRAIDAFIQENPNNLRVQDLETVSQWKAAQFGIYHIVLMPYHESFFIKEGDVYSVCGLDVQVGEIFEGGDQALVFTTLLPYEDVIVFAGELFPTGVSVHSDLRAEALERIAIKRATGEVRMTAHDFIAASTSLCV